MQKSLTLIMAVILTAFPIFASAAMNGPDAGVSANWQAGYAPGNSGNAPGKTQAQTAQPKALNNMMPDQNGAFGGMIDLKGTITGVNRDDHTFAVNGAWVNPLQFRDLARAALGSGFSVSGMTLSQAMSIWNDMSVGDKFQVRAEITPTGVRVVNWTYVRAMDSTRRNELQARLQALMQQVNQLMIQLRSTGQAGIFGGNQGNNGPGIVGTNSSTTTSTAP